MTNTINWYEKDIDDIYNHYSNLTDDECYTFLIYLLKNYSKLEIVWIDMFEDIKEHLLNSERINEVVEFIDLYRGTYPGEYESEYEFIERDLITHFLFRNDIESLKQRLEIIKSAPVHGIDVVVRRALFQLIFHGKYDLALNYSNAVWKPLLESEELTGYAHAEFSITLYLHKLELLYQDIKCGNTIDIDGFKKEVEVYGLSEDKNVYKIIVQNLTNPIDKKAIASKFEDGSNDLLLTLNIQFLKYMKEKYNTPFILSERFWNMLQNIDLFGHSSETLECFFYIPYPVLSEHVYDRYDQLYLSNEIEIFGKVFGFKYPFEFLHSNGLLSDSYYSQMKENIYMLEHEFMVNIKDSLWQMNFVFGWPQLYYPDPYQKEVFTNTYQYYSNDTIEAKLNNYLKLFTVPERIQHEINAFNETKQNELEKENDYQWEPLQPYVNDQPKVGRNDPCHCGSGKKYKKCCLGKVND